MLRLILAFLMISSPALAADELACDIKIEFGSYTASIDALTYAKIMDKVIATPAVTEKHVENLGTDGERTLCLMVKPEEIDTVYEDLKALIPLETKAGWEKITSKHGASFQTKQTKTLTRETWIR